MDYGDESRWGVPELVDADSPWGIMSGEIEVPDTPDVPMGIALPKFGDAIPHEFMGPPTAVHDVLRLEEERVEMLGKPTRENVCDTELLAAISMLPEDVLERPPEDRWRDRDPRKRVD